MNKANFIKVSDEATKEELLRQGYQLIESNNNVYTFLNCQNLNFSGDIKKLVFTNSIEL